MMEKSINLNYFICIKQNDDIDLKKNIKRYQ
jgi:hypothetical protein